MERLRQELDRYRQEQEQLRQTKARVLIMEERLRDLHWEDEVCIGMQGVRKGSVFCIRAVRDVYQYLFGSNGVGLSLYVL